jgi:hypothetical protein
MHIPFFYCYGQTAAHFDEVRTETMRTFRKTLAVVLFLLPLPAGADVGKIVDPLSCGIYDENTAPLVQAALDTQNVDPAQYTMETKTKSGKRLKVTVHNVSIKMPGERNNVTVFVDGKPFAKTSHQDVPLYLEVHIDDAKYRIICVRADPWPEARGLVGNEKQGTSPHPAR